MQKSLFFLPLAALAACATPQEQCISQVSAQARVLQAQVNETRGNIQRGYAIATVQDVRTVNTRCTGTNADGTTFTFPCQEVETVDRQEPVAINVAEERVKLADLEARLRTAQAQADAGRAQCIAQYPE